MKTITILKSNLPKHCKISKVKKCVNRYDFDFTANDIAIRSSVSRFNTNKQYIDNVIYNCLMAISAEMVEYE